MNLYEKVYVGNGRKAGEIVGYDDGRVQLHFFDDPMDVIGWYAKEHIRLTGEFPCGECGEWNVPSRQAWCDCPNSQRRREITNDS